MVWVHASVYMLVCARDCHLHDSFNQELVISAQNLSSASAYVVLCHDYEGFELYCRLNN